MRTRTSRLLHLMLAFALVLGMSGALPALAAAEGGSAETTATVSVEATSSVSQETTAAVVKPMADVCKIVSGGATTTFATLEDALAAVTAGQTITLIADISDANPVGMDQGFAFTIDKAGFDLTFEGEVDVSNATQVIITGAGALTFDYALVVFDTGSKLTVNGEMTCWRLAVVDSGMLVVTGNVTGTYDDPAGWFGFVYTGGSVTIGGSLGCDSAAFEVWNSGTTLSVGGNITAGGYGIYADSGSQVTVGGDVTATGMHAAGVACWAGADVTVNGNVRSDGVGVWVGPYDTGATATINGTITAPTYIMITDTDGNDVEFTAADFTLPTTLAGYKTYTDGVSTVWVKIPVVDQPPLDLPENVVPAAPEEGLPAAGDSSNLNLALAAGAAALAAAAGSCFVLVLRKRRA